MLLVLLCEPTVSGQERRLKLLAQCACRKYDDEGNPVLSKKEVATLWREMIAALTIASLTPSNLSEQETLEIIKSA